MQTLFASTRARALVAVLAFVAEALAAATSFAQARRGAPKSGIELAREGDCVAAVPLLERAEAAEHRPSTAAALARCHVSLGELLLAHDIWSNLAREKSDRSWSAEDRKAHAQAGEEAGRLLERIPTVELELRPEGSSATVRLGRRVVDPALAILAPPDERVVLRVEAEGYAPHEEEILLAEGGHRRLVVTLRPLGEAVRPSARPSPEPADDEHHDGPPRVWIGARYRGLLLPSFLMSVVGEGGTTAYLPGGALTLDVPVSRRLDFVGSLGAQSLVTGPFPFKPRGTPDTEWEIVESDLVALVATAELMWRFPLDDAERVSFRLGGGLGVGFSVIGDLYRTQAYPASGDPSDPDGYAPCVGPNDPAGTFRYCNQLDKDANRYGQADRALGDGGARPVVYPWLALPQLGLELRPSDGLAFDLELGVSLTGFFGGAGAKLAL